MGKLQRFSDYKTGHTATLRKYFDKEWQMTVYRLTVRDYSGKVLLRRCYDRAHYAKWYLEHDTEHNWFTVSGECTDDWDEKFNNADVILGRR